MARKRPQSRPVQSARPRPGVMTSEFWLALFPVAAGAVIAVIGALRNDTDLMAVGLTASGVTSGIYTGARTWAKRAG